MEANLDTLSVFGVNPDTNESCELNARVDKLVFSLQRFRPQQVIFIEGETWF